MREKQVYQKQHGSLSLDSQQSHATLHTMQCSTMIDLTPLYDRYRLV